MKKTTPLESATTWWAELWIDLWIAATLAAFFVLRVFQSNLVRNLLGSLRHR